MSFSSEKKTVKNSHIIENTNTLTIKLEQIVYILKPCTFKFRVMREVFKKVLFNNCCWPFNDIDIK